MASDVAVPVADPLSVRLVVVGTLPLLPASDETASPLVAATGAAPAGTVTVLETSRQSNKTDKFLNPVNMIHRSSSFFRKGFEDRKRS
jgi:hypothetical protein